MRRTEVNEETTGHRTSLLDGAFLFVASLLVLASAVLIDRYTQYGFLLPFVVLSGLGGLAALVRMLLTRPRPERTVPVETQLAELRRDEERIDQERIDTIDVLKNDPGQTTYATLLTDRRTWTTSDLVEATAERLDGQAIDGTEERAEFHGTLFGVVLPELDRAGVIEFDRARGTIELTQKGIEYGEEVLSEFTEGTAERDIISDIDLGTLFDIWSNRRRRRALEAISSSLGRSVSISKLAEEIHSTEATDEDGKKCQSIYISLAQTHLPKLEASGLVEMTGSDDVQLTETGERVVEWMRGLYTSYGHGLPDPSEAFDLLSSERRRRVIMLLAENDDAPETRSLRELATEIAAIEADRAVDDVTTEEQKRVYIGLYQVHIPKLADAGAVTYDEEAATVQLRDYGRMLAQLLGDTASRLTDASDDEPR